MITSGSAIYYDGKTSAQHGVTVELAPTALKIVDPDGAVLAEWGYAALEALSAPDGMLRLGLLRNPVLARLEINDPELAAAIGERSTPIDRSGRIERHSRARVVAWSI